MLPEILVVHGLKAGPKVVWLTSTREAPRAPLPSKPIIQIEANGHANRRNADNRVLVVRDPAGSPAGDRVLVRGKRAKASQTPHRNLQPNNATAPQEVTDHDTTSPSYRPSFEPKRAGAPGVGIVDGLGRPDNRPTTRCWPPGPMGPDGRSTHRYIGHWPPKWASKWTTGPKD